MRVVIIEDEPLTAEDLVADLKSLRPDWTVVAQLRSKGQAVEWFRQGIRHDLVISDVQLGDGTSLELFQEVPPTAPVIFCTAYDQYAVEAFQANGIGYVLKPFSSASLAAALDKFERLRPAAMDMASLGRIVGHERPRVRLLVHHRDRIIPIDPHDVAIFYLHHELTMLKCMDGSTYSLAQPLGEVETMLGTSFFRASRQHLVNKAAVLAAKHHPARKLELELKVPFAEVVTVSKEKMTIFLEWLAGGLDGPEEF